MTESSSLNSTQLQSKPIFWLTIVFIVAILERLLIILLYQPVSYSDTPSYRRLADSVLHGFQNYDGTRTPGYPVFMALVGSDQRIWFVQLFLGVVTTILLFYIGWKLTDKPWFGGLIALFHTLNLGQLFFESNLLTESITTFFIVLTMTGLLFWLLNPQKRTLWLSFLLGLISSLTLLVRPLFIYLPFFLLIFLLLTPKLIPNPENHVNNSPVKIENNPSYLHHMWTIGLAFLIPVVLLLGGWIFFIHANFDEWSLDTMTGYHLVQHTGSFFEYVPDEYSALRDTYIKYRDAHIAQYGTQTNAIWDAIPEMSQVSGYSFYTLSKVLTSISLQLILHHPFLFIKSALSGWWMFWRTSFYWSADALRLPWMTGVIKVVVLVQRGFLFLINLIFIFVSFFIGFSQTVSAIRHKPAHPSAFFTHPAKQAFFWILAGNIWITSILQTLLDHGDNPRFLVPLQSLVVLWVALFFLHFFARRQAKPIT